MDLKEFLDSRGLSDYYTSFLAHEIDLELLWELDEDDLKQLNLKIGQRKKLLKYITDHRAIFQPSTLFNEEISYFPSFLSATLSQYVNETNPKLKLWGICDFYELFLRFIVISGLAQINTRTSKIPPKLLKQIQVKIEYPTMGKWLNMARMIASNEDVDGKYAQLVKAAENLTKGIIKKGEVDSILTLRNQLAHGGGITKKVAQTLLIQWENKFESFIRDIHMLCDMHLVIKNSDEGEGFYQLKGTRSIGKDIYVPRSTSMMKKIANQLSHESAVVLVDDNEVLSLWPLIFYNKDTPGDKEYQNIYVRRGELFLEYTPVGSSTQFQTQSSKEALQYFIEMFQLKRQVDTDKESFVVRSFDNEILSDGRKLIGRGKEQQHILELLNKQGEGVYWITGNAGIGKSYLMAGVTSTLLTNPAPDKLILPYRFKAGDDRCYRSEFIEYAVERLNVWEGCINKVKKSASTYNIEDLQNQLSGLKAGRRVFFIVDGLDELPDKDMYLAEEICMSLSLSGVVWVCSGRTTVTLERIFQADLVCKVFKDGVPPMTKDDIFQMVLEKIGPLRRKLIQNDIEIENEISNPFIEQIWRFSEGIPLYVTYVIGDILSNRINYFDGKSDTLPPSIYAYHQELLKRCSISIHQQVLPRLVSTISIAKEALPFDVILSLLRKQGYLDESEKARKVLHESLTYVSPMLRTTSSN